MRKKEPVEKSKTEITKEVLCTYDNLITTIKEYSFFPKKKNSYSANQNQTNDNILYEISLFKPMLQIVLENINSFFDKVKESDPLYKQIKEKLERLIAELTKSCISLIEAEKQYHDTWNVVNRNRFHEGFATHSDLGYAKTKWRLTRNKACCSILNFYKEINEISIFLQNINYPVDKAIRLFNCGIERITKGPNYYCYLSEKDRKNVLRKRKRKNT